jgi:hypothetical protein
MEKDILKAQFITRNTLCRTIAGNKCEYITITGKNHPDVKFKSLILIIISKSKKEKELL